MCCLELQNHSALLSLTEHGSADCSYSVAIGPTVARRVAVSSSIRCVVHGSSPPRCCSSSRRASMSDSRYHVAGNGDVPDHVRAHVVASAQPPLIRRWVERLHQPPCLLCSELSGVIALLSG